MSIRAIAALLIVLLVLTVAPKAAVAQPAGSTEPEITLAANTYADGALVDALRRAGLLSEWIDASGISADASLVEVSGSGGYGEARQALLQELSVLGELVRLAEQRRAGVASAMEQRDALIAVARDLQAAVFDIEQQSPRGLPLAQVRAVQAELSAVARKSQWRSISADPVAVANIRLVSLGQVLSSEAAELGRSAGMKAPSERAARLAAVQAELGRVTALLNPAQSELVMREVMIEEASSKVVEQFGGLHSQRLLRSTSVGGVSLVTLDAYVRAAEVVDAGCPVDWALLAGIGRIESRHGTMDNASVQRNGRLTRRIFGPLLDGGATEREAAEAEAAALAELLRIEAEEAALAAAIEADRRDRLFGSQDFGADESDQPDTDASADSDSGDRDIERPADDETVTDEPSDELPPQFDPALWGDQSGDAAAEQQSSGDDDDDDDARLDEDDEEEIPELPGNGFAVIEDSDNGQLDGNDRWDRAIGPMQFIPETWSYWKTDGNGDGVIDPQNLYDAATSAARFLCHLSRSRGSAPTRFILGYNSSDVYVQNVLDVARALRAAGSLPSTAS